MRTTIPLYFLSVLILCLSSFTASAEGTREFMPSAGDWTVMQIWDNGDPNRNTGTYDCPADKRINFHIEDFNIEQVYFGFGNIINGGNNANAGHWDGLRYRIRRPDGSIFAAHNNVQITAALTPINSHAQAVAGPAQLVGAAGYEALHFTPDMNGDWYIEFNRGADPNATPRNKTLFQYFDLTVSDGYGPFGNNAGNYVAGGTPNTGVQITGRLWSQTWDFNCLGGGNPFLGVLYAYTNDQVVMGINFNGIRPFGFTISSNSTGVSNTGNVAIDRRSVNGNSTYPEYPLFFNNPDSTVWPSGIIPQLDTPQVDVDLCTDYYINVTTNAAGFIEVLLDMSDDPANPCSPVYAGDGAYTPPQPGCPTKDVLLGINAPSAGTFSIPWNGLDGAGNPVPYGTNISAVAVIQLGLTHLPLFDVENHPNGYDVFLVRPVGPPPPRLYWDDSNIGGAVQILPGVVPPAHSWGGNFGNNRTLNTWFFVAESSRREFTFLADDSEFAVAPEALLDVCDNVTDSLKFRVEFSRDKFNIDSLIFGATPNQTLGSSNYSLDSVSAVLVDSFVDIYGIWKYEVEVTYLINPDPGATSLTLFADFAVQTQNVCNEQIIGTGASDCEIILPIELREVRADAKPPEGILLQWETSFESKNAGFEVQHSTDGEAFFPVGFVEAARNASQGANYAFLHTEPQEGINYYRLRQVDLNNTSRLLPVVAERWELQATDGNAFEIFPNPSGGELSLRQRLGESKLAVHVQCTDIQGRVVFQAELSPDQFIPTASFELPRTLPNGLYLLRFSNKLTQEVHKVTLRR